MYMPDVNINFYAPGLQTAGIGRGAVAQGSSGVQKASIIEFCSDHAIVFCSLVLFTSRSAQDIG